MKKPIFICLLFLVLIGCSAKDSHKLSGKEVNAKLEKNGLKLVNNDNDDGFGYIFFWLPKKDEPNDSFVIRIYYSNDEVTGFRFDESTDEVSDRYIYDMKNDYSYVYLTNDNGNGCVCAIDGKAPKKKVCSGKREEAAKKLYNECYKKILKQIGITKDDLITFGDWYNKNNTD